MRPQHGEAEMGLDGARWGEMGLKWGEMRLDREKWGWGRMGREMKEIKYNLNNNLKSELSWNP